MQFFLITGASKGLEPGTYGTGASRRSRSRRAFKNDKRGKARGTDRIQC